MAIKVVIPGRLPMICLLGGASGNFVPFPGFSATIGLPDDRPWWEGYNYCFIAPPDTEINNDNLNALIGTVGGVARVIVKTEDGEKKASIGVLSRGVIASVTRSEKRIYYVEWKSVEDIIPSEETFQSSAFNDLLDRLTLRYYHFLLFAGQDLPDRLKYRHDRMHIGKFVDGIGSMLNVHHLANDAGSVLALGVAMRELDVEKRAKALLHLYEFLFEMHEAKTSEPDEDGPTESSGAPSSIPITATGDLPAEVEEAIKRERARKERSTGGEKDNIIEYLSWLEGLPWNKSTVDPSNLVETSRILNEDHFGLEKVKDSILQHLAVKILNPSGKSRILCLIGPPGVGKTSLGASIARSLGRKFARISLGGVHDASDIRGHRRTYIGSMPGQIIKRLREAGTNNPVFLFDEIDKMGTQSAQGNPQAALLEVLDPEQNTTFRDHYLDLPFDLSKVLFILTANSSDGIPDTLLDRVDVIYLPGYAREEKIDIAQHFLVKKQGKECGLTEFLESDPKPPITDEVLRYIIEEYTNEAGVRELERLIGKIFRIMACNIVSEVVPKWPLTIHNVGHYLGASKRHETLSGLTDLEPGVVPFLAVSSRGGSVGLIEVSSRSVVEGKGRTEITGNLGKVIEQSVKVAISRAKFPFSKELANRYLHIHFEDGATPKDGPSAGVAIYLAICSAALGKSIKSGLAITGEIALVQNTIGPVGGIREKILAAIRMGIKEIGIPASNLLDLEELPTRQRAEIEVVSPGKHPANPSHIVVHPLENLQQAIRLAFPKDYKRFSYQKLLEKSETT